MEEVGLVIHSTFAIDVIKTNDTIALIDVNPVTGTYHLLAQSRTQEQMIENAAVLIRVLKIAHASRFKKFRDS